MTTSPTTDRYRTVAEHKFRQLLSVYSAGNASFWKLGNTLDTMVDFLEVIDGSGAGTVAKLVLQQYTASLNKLGGYNAAWFDDFGWWTVASQRATVSSVFNQDAKKAFATNLSECWSRFTGNAPYVWDRREPGTFNNCQPAVTGGVWNEYWKGTSSIYPGPKSGDPTSGTLGGIQNTVTNTVYLMAAQRLGDTDPNAKAAAEREFAFLFNWFSKAPLPLFHAFSGTEALMCERVSQFFDGSGAPGFQNDWFWTGDLGLMLGALTDRISRAKQPPLLDHATSLLRGARNRLTDDKGLLQNWSDSGYVPDGDEGDYQVGAGVFWRNLLYAWKNNATLRGVIGQRDYQTFVQTNADAAAASTLATFDSLTQDVAVLTAATAVLP